MTALPPVSCKGSKVGLHTFLTPEQMEPRYAERFLYAPESCPFCHHKVEVYRTDAGHHLAMHDTNGRRM